MKLRNNSIEAIYLDVERENWRKLENLVVLEDVKASDQLKKVPLLCSGLISCVLRLK